MVNKKNCFGLRIFPLSIKLKFLTLLSFFPEVYTSTWFVPFPIILCKLVVGGIYKVKYKSNWNQSWIAIPIAWATYLMNGGSSSKRHGINSFLSVLGICVHPQVARTIRWAMLFICIFFLINAPRCMVLFLFVDAPCLPSLDSEGESPRLELYWLYMAMAPLLCCYFVEGTTRISSD